MNRIRRPEDFMSTGVFEFTEEPTLMNKEIPTPFCI